MFHINKINLFKITVKKFTFCVLKHIKFHNKTIAAFTLVTIPLTWWLSRPLKDRDNIFRGFETTRKKLRKIISLYKKLD